MSSRLAQGNKTDLEFAIPRILLCRVRSTNISERLPMSRMFWLACSFDNIFTTAESGTTLQHLGGIFDSFLQASMNQSFRHETQIICERHLSHSYGKFLAIQSGPSNSSRQTLQVLVIVAGRLAILLLLGQLPASCRGCGMCCN